MTISSTAEAVAMHVQMAHSVFRAFAELQPVQSQPATARQHILIPIHQTAAGAATTAAPENTVIRDNVLQMYTMSRRFVVVSASVPISMRRIAVAATRIAAPENTVITVNALRMHTIRRRFAAVSASVPISIRRIAAAAARIAAPENTVIRDSAHRMHTIRRRFVMDPK